MPLPIITNTVRVVYEGRLEQGTNWANIIHCRHPSGAPSGADIAALLVELDRLYTGASYGGGATFWSGAATNGAVLDTITITPLDGTSASTVATVGQAGANTADPLPAGTALVLTHRTNLRGRSFRGRTYIAGWGEDMNTATGNPDQTAITLFVSQWTQFRAALSPINWEFVVASYLTSQATPVVGTTADARWDSQRRRNPR